MFKGVLHKLGIGRREAVLGGERLLRPNRGAISRCDVPNRSQQFLPQRGRLLGLEGARPLAMHAVATLSIAGLSRRHPRLSVPRLERAFVSWTARWRARTITKIGRIQIVLAGDADQREQGVTAGVGQGRAHALGIGSFGYGTDRPIRCDPFAGGVRKRGGQIDHSGRMVDGGRLHGRNLMLAERLAHDVEATRERRIAEAALPLPYPAGPDRGRQRLFRVDELGLGLGQGRGEGRDRFTGSGHGSPPSPGRRSSPRPISSAWLVRHARSPPWHPRASGP